MVVQRKDSGEDDMYLNEQEVDVEEEDKRGRRVGSMNVEEKDRGIEKADVEDVDVDVDDGKDIYVVLLTHNVKSLSLNLTQVTHCHPAHIYVSLVGYLVPHHHLLIQFLHVNQRLCSRVFLCGKREEKVCAEMKVNIFSMTTTDRPSYQGSGAETTVESGHRTTKWLCLVIVLFLVSTHLLITCSPYFSGKLGGAWEQDYWAC